MRRVLQEIIDRVAYPLTTMVPLGLVADERRLAGSGGDTPLNRLGLRGAAEPGDRAGKKYDRRGKPVGGHG